MRLIDADALKRWLEANKANVNPLDYNTRATYAECITMVELMETMEFPRCPNCGARMDGAAKKELTKRFCCENG